MKTYYVYILASRKDGTLYIGVISDLRKRMYEHRQKAIEGFTKKYNVSKLMYYEHTSDVHAALQREKQLKRWERKWKEELIEKDNPEWCDLHDSLFEE
jgi:putative endonuclease